MGSKIEQLTSLVAEKNPYKYSQKDLLPTQLAAANELIETRINQIGLLKHRAESAGVSSVNAVEDIVPLLFAHTAYKSYPENWVANKKWDLLSRWLETVSTYPVEGLDSRDITGIDDWVDSLEAVGKYVSCSSGTTGKSAMLVASAADMAWTRRETVAAFSWGAGIEPSQDRRMFGLTPVAAVPKNLAVRAAFKDAFGIPGEDAFTYPVPPITIGQITGMVALRKRIEEGLAEPAEIRDYEETSAARQKAVEGAVEESARALIDARHEKFFISGMWATIYKIAEAVRDMGYSGSDFRPENTVFIGGGLKGAVLPDNYREFVCETLNMSQDHILQMYGMQEINTTLPRCSAGRYHAPPWLILLVLDPSGETLLPASSGEVEGRAAFLDLSLDGRWGGVISGDKIVADFGKCPCGNEGPTIQDNVTRYSELPGGDKISCSGTIDAYVRGVV